MNPEVYCTTGAKEMKSGEVIIGFSPAKPFRIFELITKKEQYYKYYSSDDVWFYTQFEDRYKKFKQDHISEIEVINSLRRIELDSIRGKKSFWGFEKIGYPDFVVVPRSLLDSNF
jgi:hypothetical protein